MPWLVTMALLCLCCGLPGLARGASDDNCANSTFADQDIVFGLAKVTVGGSLGPCPDDSAECRLQVYVVPGDTVITGAVIGSYICAFFPDKRYGTSGYVRLDELARQPKISTAPQAAWVGTWRYGDNFIRLSAHGRSLTAAGEAYFPSKPTLERPYVHFGYIGGTTAPIGNTAVFGSKDLSECRVALTLMPPFLLATDNKKCGGANVTYSGVYQKR